MLPLITHIPMPKLTGQLQIINARPGYIKTVLPVEKRHLNNHKVNPIFDPTHT
jgi:hypothetical protein